MSEKTSFKPISVFESKREDMIKSESVLPLVTLISRVHMTSLLYDVIGLFCPKERQKSKLCSVTRWSVPRCIRDKLIAKLPYTLYLQGLFLKFKADVNKEALRLRV